MTDREIKNLESTPSTARLYARAVAGFGSSTVGGLPLVGGLPGLSRVPGFGRAADRLPETLLVLSGVDIDAAHLHRYQEVCDFERSDRLPLTYPHMLAFPLAMELMTDPAFPFPVIGMVHIENRITQHRALVAGDALDVRAWAHDLRGHKRGRQFDVSAEVRVEDEPVWESQSTYLHYGGGSEEESSGRSSSKDGDDHDSEPSDPEITSTWEVGGDVGRRYGAVSGDRNPIHMHPLTARLFGMPRAIAHGMWVKARCLAALQDHESDDAASVRASFKLPLLLPARVQFSSWMDGDERRFSVRDADSGKPHLSGGLR